MKIFEIDDSSLDYQKIAEVLSRDCLPYLAGINYNVADMILYRGSSRFLGQFVRRRIRAGRDPVDTKMIVHEIFDQWFLNKSGIRYRSNAIFTTGDGFLATKFGGLYAVFPIGKFNFCYSPYVRDLTEETGKIIRNLGFSYGDLDDDAEVPEDKRIKLTESIIRFLNDQEYRFNASILNAIRSFNEVMINCQEYYALQIPRNDPSFKDPGLVQIERFLKP